MNLRGCALRRIVQVPLLAWVWLANDAAAETWREFPTADRPLRYTLKPTGANFTFDFPESPGSQAAKLEAAQHVLHAAYDDESIEARQSSFFMKEGAKCFVFDARFHTYTACFLPNDYSPGNERRFWGYVTQVPNGWWLVTHNLAPAVLVLGLFGFWLRRRPSGGIVMEGAGNRDGYRPIR